MGKAYSTQLKICNDTSSTITSTVSRVKAGDFLGLQTPDKNFHQIKIPPDSEYSREHVINLRRAATVFSLTMRFENDKEPKTKELLFRIDQGRVADKKRNQCRRHKEKNIFEFVGDENAFDVKDIVSGNTLTIRIKDSYMYEFGNKEGMRMKAEQIAAEQKKVAQETVAKAEAVKRAKEEAKMKEEVEKTREEDEVKNAMLLMAEMGKLADEERQETVKGEEVRTRNESCRDSLAEERETNSGSVRREGGELTGNGSVSGVERRRTEEELL